MLWSRPGPAAVTFCLRERRRKEAVTQQRSHVTSVTHFLLSTVIFVRRQTMGLLLERSAFARVHSCAHFVVADINMRKCFILRKKSCGQTRSREDLHKPASWHCCLFFCLFSLVRSPTQRDYYSNIRRAPSAEYHLISWVFLRHPHRLWNTIPLPSIAAFVLLLNKQYRRGGLSRFLV